MFRPIQVDPKKKVFEFGEALIATEPLIGLQDNMVNIMEKGRGGMLAVCAPFGHGKLPRLSGQLWPDSKGCLGVCCVFHQKRVKAGIDLSRREQEFQFLWVLIVEQSASTMPLQTKTLPPKSPNDCVL